VAVIWKCFVNLGVRHCNYCGFWGVYETGCGDGSLTFIHVKWGFFLCDSASMLLKSSNCNLLQRLRRSCTSSYDENCTRSVESAVRNSDAARFWGCVRWLNVYLIHMFEGRYRDLLRAGRSGDRIPVWARFSAPVQTDPGAYPASNTVGTDSFPGVKAAVA